MSRKNNITQDVRPSNCFATAYTVALSQKFESPGLYQLNSQSSMRRQGCYCWELQDEPFVFCGRIGTACVDLLNRVFSTHLIDFLLRATEQERKSALKI